MSIGILREARLLGLAALVGMTGCSGGLQKTIEDTFPGREAEYKTSRTLPTLEVPPDLTAPSTNESMDIPGSGSVTYSEYAGAAQRAAYEPKDRVLPESAEVRVARSGDKRWMVVKATPSQVWPKVREFWLEQGFLIKMEDPAIGIMETDWAENRADIPKDFIRSMLEKVTTALYSAATRDKFRTRLERGAEPGTTEVYISHRGAEEVTQGESFVWQPRPSDPELEAEMLNRMMVYLGVTRDKARRMLAQTADRAPRAQMVRGANGDTSLTLSEDFSRAWRRTGLALDRVGFTVEDRDRSRGLYYVRYVDPLRDDDEKGGWLSKLKFWGDDDAEKLRDTEYLISLNEEGETTQVFVLDKEGKRENSSTADRILSLLHEQLK